MSSRSRLALARSATPSHLRYRWLGLQFAVEENFSTGHGRFLHSLLSLRGRLVRHAHDSPIVSTLLGLPLLTHLPVLSRCLVTATIHSLGWQTTALSHPPTRDCHGGSPSVTLCRRIALPRWPMSTPWDRSNVPHGITPYFSPGSP